MMRESLADLAKGMMIQTPAEHFSGLKTEYVQRMTI
jgi:hypothetical protein